ncbi:hypothetical protein [Roseimaritima multifibrata]|uniref:hypothetical protein n=1 Tax=Roseimaritima multifibrata TaxID=1930274 RepID=UPI0011A910AB|nr:hypothetical protein [Roseimaritima multifibrata]
MTNAIEIEASAVEFGDGDRSVQPIEWQEQQEFLGKESIRFRNFAGCNHTAGNDLANAGSADIESSGKEGQGGRSLLEPGDLLGAATEMP